MRRAFILVMALAVVGLAACGGDSTSGSTTSTRAASAASTITAPATTTAALSGDITVDAASSLMASFTQLGKDFEAAHPGVHVTFNFGASSDLVTQINQGAPADVFASADTTNMQKATTAGTITATPQNFVQNKLEVATPPGNPKGITGLTDFANSSLLIGLCDPSVPCGKYALQALAMAGISPSVDTNATSVANLLTQIESGDLDAGIVYVTDVKSAGDKVSGVEIPDAQNVIATYPIAPIKSSAHSGVAAAFIDYVLSPAGQQTLASYGFLSR